jgi:hypothetical protein
MGVATAQRSQSTSTSLFTGVYHNRPTISRRKGRAMSKPQEWTIREVLIPLLGRDWRDARSCDYGSVWSGSFPEADRGHIDRLHHLAGAIHRMAGNAQHDCLAELKTARRLLRQVTREFSEAVDFAESRAENYRKQRAAAKQRKAVS